MALKCSLLSLEYEMAHKKTLVLDFDGVLHSYSSGWGGHEVVADPPVPGAMAFLYDALKSFKVCIFSSRSSTPQGIEAMQMWVAKHAKPLFFDYGQPWWLQIEWPVNKPAAHVTIDDRAITFDGNWPSMAELVGFKPWFQLPKVNTLAKAVEFLATEGEGS
jgi:hypothetical protein